MENSNDIKSIDIEERLNPSLTNATVNIVTYTFRMKYVFISQITKLLE